MISHSLRVSLCASLRYRRGHIVGKGRVASECMRESIRHLLVVRWIFKHFFICIFVHIWNVSDFMWVCVEVFLGFTTSSVSAFLGVCLCSIAPLLL